MGTSSVGASGGEHARGRERASSCGKKTERESCSGLTNTGPAGCKYNSTFVGAWRGGGMIDNNIVV